MHEIWRQEYLLLGCGLSLSAILAGLPIFTLMLFLGILRKPAWMAGLFGLAVTIALAVGGYHMPIHIALSAAANGAAFGIFPIFWIVIWAIVLYRMTVETGKFTIIRDSIGRLTEDPRMQALLVAFAFGAFLEGAAGFGTPVAIAAAMLTGLGFSPFRAAAVSLLANAAGGAFGAIGIPVITLAAVTGLPVGTLSAVVAAICSPVSCILPAYLIAAMEGVAALSEVWGAALSAGVAFAAVQLLVSVYFGPQLTDILSAIASFIAMVVFLRLRRPFKEMELATAVGAGDSKGAGSWRSEPAPAVPYRSAGEVLAAWVPYGLLVICVLVWGIKPVQSLLDKTNFSLAWPWLDGVIVRMPPVAAAPTAIHAVFLVNWLSAAGTACMIATLLSAVYLGMSVGQFLWLFVRVCRQLALPTVTVASVLAIAFLMNDSGAAATLGLAFAATGKLFPFFSVLLGWLGVFLTGSDTSSNALFGNLQVVSAQRLGLDPVLMSAANAVGGAMGKMISLQTIAVAAAATAMPHQDQVKLFRFTLRHSTLLVVIVALVTLAFAYLAY